MTTSPKDWKSYYELDYDMAELNTQMDKVLALAKFENSNDDCIKNLKNNPGLAIIAVDSFNEIYLFHQVHVLGPSLLFPSERIMALSGQDFPNRCYKLNSDTLFLDVEVPVPDWDFLSSAETVDFVRRLVVDDSNSSKLQCKNVLVVPPFVVSLIMDLNISDPTKLLLHLLEGFKKYDKDSSEQETCENLRLVVKFLWAASQLEIPAISFSPDSSEAGKKWAIALHSSTFPNQGFTTSSANQNQVNQNVWENINETLKKISEGPSSLKELSSEDTKKDSSNSWEKIPDVLQQMILKLSSTNDEHFPIGPTTTYLQVLKQGKALGVAMVLNVMLSTMGCQVEITTSMANAIKTGNFRANSLLVAHSFSIFNVPYLDAAQMTNFNQTELDLLQSEGEGIPKEIVKKLSENKFKTPTSTHLLRHQFNNWYGLFQIIFGQKALTTLEIREWIDHIDKHETSYDAGFKGDKDFGAKILGLIDLTFFQFCESCLKASKPEDINYSKILLENKRQEILQNCFQANKPVYLLTNKHPPPSPDSTEKDQDKNGRGKRFKKEKDGQQGGEIDLGKAVTNTNPVKEWLVTKNYRKIFHKGVNKFTPPFNAAGDTTCNKWHLQGYCFEKCDRKATHKAFSDEAIKQANAKWIKEVKEKSPHKAS